MILNESKPNVKGVKSDVLDVLRRLMVYKVISNDKKVFKKINELINVMEKAEEFGLTRNILGNKRPITIRDIQGASTKAISKYRRRNMIFSNDNKGHLQDGYSKYQINQLAIVKKITGHRSSVYCVKYSLKRDIIITGSDDYLIKSFSAHSLKLLKSFRGHRNCIVDILTMYSEYREEEVLVSSSVDTEVRVWGLVSSHCLVVIQWHTAACGPLCYTDILVTTSDDGMCCLWQLDVIIANIHHTLPTTTEENKEIPFSEKRLINRRNQGDHIPIVLPHLQERVKVNVNCVSKHTSGEFIATGADDGIGRIWSILPIENKKCRNTPNAETIQDQQLSSKAYLDGSTRLCCSLKAHNASITNILWSNKGDRLITSSVKDGNVKIWVWGEGSLTPNLFLTPHTLTLDSVSPNSSSFLHRSTTVIPETRIVALVSQLLSAIEQNPSFSLPTYLSSSNLAQEEANELKSLLMKRSFVREKKATVDAAIWTSDDSRIVTMQSTPTKLNESGNFLDSSGFSDQVLKVWDSRSGKQQFQTRKHRRPSYCVLAHPHFSNIVVTLGHDSQICYWDVVEQRLIKSVMVSAMFGPCSLLDGIFSENFELIVTDSYGRLVILANIYETEVSRGSQCVFKRCKKYSHTFSEQFFKNEYNQLEYDAKGFCVDVLTRLSPHLSPLGPLCSTTLEPYSVQEDNQRKQALVSYLDSTIEQRERNAMAEVEETLKSMDLLLLLASKCDQFDELSVINYSTLFKNVIVNSSRLERNNLTLSAPQQVEVASPEPVLDVRRSERQRNRPFLAQLPDETPTEPRRRRAARRAGERIRYFRQLTSQMQTEVTESPVMLPIEDDSEFSESDVEVVDDPEEIIRMNRRRRRLRRSVRLQSRVEESVIEERGEDVGETQVQPDPSDRLAELVSSRGHYARLNRSWLQEESLNHAFGNYVPQVGDEVVFSVQGFEEYVKIYYPGQVLSYLGAASESPYVLCKVTSLKYEFPRGGLDSIVATIHLKLLATPVEQETERESEFWCSVETREGFELSLVSHDCSDFLILKQVFEESLKQNWTRRDPIKCYYLTEERTLDFDSGWIRAVDTSDEANWPDSKWKCLLICWNDGSSDMRVSPWEIEKPGNDLESRIREMVCIGGNERVNLLEALSSLQNERFSRSFCERVPPDIYVDYNLIVPVSIELDLIKKRIENHFYRSVESIKFDVELLYENCLNYNLPDSEIAQEAGLLRNHLLKAIKKATKRDTVPIVSQAQESEEEEESDHEQEVSSRGRKRRRVIYATDSEASSEEEEPVEPPPQRSRTRRNLSFVPPRVHEPVRRSARSSRAAPNYHVPDEFDEDIAEEPPRTQLLRRRSSRSRSSRVINQS